jgi:flavin-dependent dehydrogenase
MNETYDVVIMGGGIGGNFQARHLVLNIPGIRVAMIEPRSPEEVAKISKIGESTVEIAGMFMVKELGLGAYLTERHLPKNGLNFHWPKRTDSTATMDDYYSIWALRQPTIHAWQLHRGRLEADLMAMNAEAGVDVIQAKVSGFDIGADDAPNVVHIKQGDGTQRSLHCTHVIDAAGRAFLTGKKFDNILRRPTDRFGTHAGAAWVRVKNVDRNLFHDEVDGLETASTRYYGTNHFFGHGHWLWMIPLSREDMELSVGMMHHHGIIEAKEVNSRAKFLAFLKENHSVLHRIVSGADPVDFNYWAAPAHTCKQVFNKDNWSALGDAIYFGDAFYSVGISALCVTIECTTELIRAKRAGEDGLEEKRSAYDDYVRWFATTNAHTYRYHRQMLGDASIMSWRIYFEYMWWFGALVPSYVGKWHLDVGYIREQLDNCPRDIHDEIYRELCELAASGRNIGFMDPYRADQLAFDYFPDKQHVPYLENATYGPGALNIYASAAATHYYSALWWMKLQWRAHGARCLLRPRTLKVFSYLVRQTVRIRARAAAFELQHRGGKKTDPFHALQEEFSAYEAVQALRPWTKEARKAAG